MTSTQQTEPDVLYHYTDAYGLVGIVNPTSWPIRIENPEKVFKAAAKILASDVRYMNDSQGHRQVIWECLWRSRCE